MKKKKIKLSPQQIADLVNQSLMDDSLVLAATQRGVGGVVESVDIEERMRKLDEKFMREKAREAVKAGKRRRIKRARKKRR